MSLPLRRHIPPLGAPKLSPREKVLATWRGVDVTPAVRANQRREKSAEALVAQQKADIAFWWPIIRAAGIKQQ